MHAQRRVAELSEDPPVAIAAVDTAAKIGALVGDVVAMTGRGLVTLERARLITRQRPERCDSTATATPSN